MALKRFGTPTLSVVLFMITGCAGAANTANPSTYDLLFRQDQLEANLADKRQQLEGLKAKLDRLESDLSEANADLSKAQFALVTRAFELESEREEAVRIADQIGEQIEAGRVARIDLKNARQQRTDLLGAIASAAISKAEHDRQIAELESDIDLLETQVGAIQVANHRLLDMHMNILGGEAETS